MEGKTECQDLYPRLKTEDPYEVGFCIILKFRKESYREKEGGKRKMRNILVIMFQLQVSPSLFLCKDDENLSVSCFFNHMAACSFPCKYISWRICVCTFGSEVIVIVTLFGCEDILLLTACFSRVIACISTEVKSIEWTHHLDLIMFTSDSRTSSYLTHLPGAQTAASCPHQADVVPEPGQCSWQ